MNLERNLVVTLKIFRRSRPSVPHGANFLILNWHCDIAQCFCSAYCLTVFCFIWQENTCRKQLFHEGNKSAKALFFTWFIRWIPALSIVLECFNIRHFRFFLSIFYCLFTTMSLRVSFVQALTGAKRSFALQFNFWDFRTSNGADVDRRKSIDKCRAHFLNFVSAVHTTL